MSDTRKVKHVTVKASDNKKAHIRTIKKGTKGCDYRKMK